MISPAVIAIRATTQVRNALFMARPSFATKPMLVTKEGHIGSLCVGSSPPGRTARTQPPAPTRRTPRRIASESDEVSCPFDTAAPAGAWERPGLGLHGA